MNFTDCSEGAPEPRIGPIKRRHVIYLAGYEPRGAKGYFEFFQRTCDRFNRLCACSAIVQPLQIESAQLAHWQVDLRGSDWHIATHYDFLRFEDFVVDDMSRPLPRHIFRAAAWIVGDLLSGSHFRIFSASWRFGLFHLSLQLMLLAWLSAGALAGLAAARAITHSLGSPLFAIALGTIAGLLCLAISRPVIEKFYAVRVANSWAELRKFARGQPTWLDSVIENGARRVLAIAQAGKVDELAVVSHSSGCILGLAVIARAMAIDPELGRKGPRLILLTLGSIMPALALCLPTPRLRNIVSQIATSTALTWIDAQSLLDVACFANFDPVRGIGLDPGTDRYNPVVWQISFAEMIAPENYRRFRRNWFRVHFQYIMGGDRRGSYDYIWMVAGPFAIVEWPRRQHELMLSLSTQEKSRDDVKQPAMHG
jgi:hypothetical protein